MNSKAKLDKTSHVDKKQSKRALKTNRVSKYEFTKVLKESRNRIDLTPSTRGWTDKTNGAASKSLIRRDSSHIDLENDEITPTTNIIRNSIFSSKHYIRYDRSN